MGAVYGEGGGVVKGNIILECGMRRDVVGNGLTFVSFSERPSPLARMYIFSIIFKQHSSIF